MYKRYLMIILGMLLVLALAGCGGDEKEKDDSEAAKNYVFNELDLAFDSEKSISYGYSHDGKIFYCENVYSEYPEEFYTEMEEIYGDSSLSFEQQEERIKELSEGKYKDSLSEGSFTIYSYDIASGESKELFKKTGDMSSEIYDKFFVNEDGTVNVFASIFGDDDGEGTPECYLKKFAADGSEISSINLGELTQTTGNPGSLDLALFNRDGSVIFTYTLMDMTNHTNSSSAVYKLDAEGKPAGKIELTGKEDGIIEGLSFDEDGNAVMKWYDGKNGIKVSYLDFETGAIGEELALETEEKKEQTDMDMGPFDSYNLISTMNHELLFKDSTYLYKYNKETKTMDIILNFMDAGVPANNIMEMGPTEDGKYICVISNMNMDIKFGILEEGVAEAVEKTTLKYVSIYGSDMNAQENIVNFNKTSDKYKVEYISYEDSENAEEAFANDIIAGNYPDIVDLNNVDSESFINKGLLTDLTPYIESDDTINRDYFIDGLLDAMAVDGKQYGIINGFSLRSLAGKKSQLEQYKDNWTFENMLNYIESKEKGTNITGIDTKMSVLMSMINIVNPFINKKTGEVSYDSDLFARHLELCNQYKNDDEISEDEWSKYNEIEAIKKDKQIFSSAYISGTADIARNSKLFNGDVLYIGYPDAKKGNGTYILPHALYGIMDTCEDKDGAWEYIKYAMTVEDPDKIYMGIPSDKETFEEVMKRDKATEQYVTEDGETVFPRDETMSFGDSEIQIGPATDEDIAVLKDLIANASGFTTYYVSEEQVILSEEVEKYFKGDKGLKETQDVLQDRTKKYINEQM